MNETEHERRELRQEAALDRFEHSREAQTGHKRLQVNLNIHPLASLVAVGVVSIIVFVSWAAWVISHHEDFISVSTGLMHDGTWVVKAVVIVGFIWLCVEVAGRFIKHVIHPIIDAVQKSLFAIGQLKRNRVLARDLNYAVLEDVDTGQPQFHQVTQERNSFNYKIDSNPGPSQLPSPNVAQPTQEYAVSQLRENGLQVCFGVSTTTQQPFVINLLDGVHYRLLGASGMGKSCLAGSVLDQITTTNDEHHLQIALLDSEHKTSRLFEHLPHVAELHVGRKRVECVATSPEEVAEHMGYLKLELDRRKELSELALQKERFMLIYIEEFLSLKREMPRDLRMQFLRDFSILALRGRKYKLYLLACAQVDYASKAGGEEAEILREAQNQFSVNASFAVRPKAAQAAGFTNYELIEQNFNLKRVGQLVLETTGVSDMMLAPRFDVAQKLIALERSQVGANPRTTTVLGDAPHQNIIDSHLVRTDDAPEDAPSAPASEDKLAQVADLLARGYNQGEIIEKVWRCTKGGNDKYYQARAEYLQLVNMIKQRQAQTIELGA